MNYWDRPTLKQRAKNVLRVPGVYWTSVLVYLIFGLLGAGSAGGSSSAGSSGSSSGYGSDSAASDFFNRYWLVVVLAILLIIVISLAWQIFVSNTITVGKNRYFLDIRSGPGTVGTVFWGFKDGKYMQLVKSMFAMSIRVFLWSLLLIVP
ncbi:MAG: hypothetical protein Q4B42_03420, partial [Oscillospiraceae bacterium]|nr:hypothetical protein [Oscillospiraceae bacterium]